MSFFIYILESQAGIFYVGYSNDPYRRVLQHNSKSFNTYTSKHRPWHLAAIFLVGENERTAIKMERYIKRQKSKELLRKLIDPFFTPTGELVQLVRIPHVRD